LKLPQTAVVPLGSLGFSACGMNDAEFAAEFAARSKKYQTVSQTQLKAGPTEVEIATKAHVRATLKSKAEQERKAKAFAARSVAVQRMVDVSRVAVSGVSALSSSGSVTVPDDLNNGDSESSLPHEFRTEFERAQVCLPFATCSS
jgi:hypothetical protein